MRRRVVHVSNGRAYPNAWARFISELIERPGWSQQRLADTAGVDRGTVRRWRNGTSVNVSARSIALIADAAGVDQDIAARAALGAREQVDKADDLAIREVMDSDIPQEYKDEIIEHIRLRRAEAEETLRRDIELMVRTRRAAS
jgi:transcriptional regulator with XRE-family HTH domain